jgi:4-carboxymuconolactone decarboxylase
MRNGTDRQAIARSSPPHPNHQGTPFTHSIRLRAKENFIMSEPRPANLAQQAFGDVAPKLAQLADEVLFGDVWERPQLSKRDRSMITCAALIAGGKTEQMAVHFPRALANGVTREELVEMVTHLAFYAGWPSAMSAVTRLKEMFGQAPKG